MQESDNIRRALEELLEDLINCHNFEVEYGASGGGSMFRAYQALGKPLPQEFLDWLSTDENSWDSWDE